MAQQHSADDTASEGDEYLVTAVVHFRVRGVGQADATAMAKARFSDALEASDVFGDGAVATVMLD